jgi:hypothetical protein
VRVAADELLVDQPRRLLEVALAALLQEQREEVDLEEQVAELVEQLLVVAGERGVGDLVRLLDRVRDDRALGLLAVPRAVAPQALGQRLQLDEGLRQATDLSWSCRSRWMRSWWPSAGNRPGSGRRS